MDPQMIRAVSIRVAICIVIGVLGGWLISEGSYQINKDPVNRDQANRVVLEIPAGTADLIAKGGSAPQIPSSMTFVAGDILVVKNDDTVSHQLGPIWVPPLSSGVLQIETADEYSYACTFEKSKVFGLTVLPQLTLASRIQGALTIGLPTALLFGLYSTIVFPLKKKPAVAA